MSMATLTIPLERLLKSQEQILQRQGFLLSLQPEPLAFAPRLVSDKMNPLRPQDESSHPPKADGSAEQRGAHGDEVLVAPEPIVSYSSTPALSRQATVIYLDVRGPSLVFHNPPTQNERTLQSLLTIHDHFASTNMAPAQRLAAMTPVIHFIRSCMNYSFRIMDTTNHVSNDQAIAENDETVATAALAWLDANSARSGSHMSASTWQQIEQLVLDEDNNHNYEQQPRQPGAVHQYHHYDHQPYPNQHAVMGHHPEAVPSHVASLGHVHPTRRRRRSSIHGESTTIDPTVSDEVVRSRKRSRRDQLEEQLIQVQKRVTRNHDFDVRRGKGQGVKNLNARLYTPLVRDRCLEYAAIDTGHKNHNDELKHSVAMEILIELAKHGGRILDEDNVTVLDNQRAVKKVMNALKDKAREMKRKGEEDSVLPNEPVSIHNVRPLDPSHNRSAEVHALPVESVEPEPLVQGEAFPEEGEALARFSSYWLRRREG